MTDAHVAKLPALMKAIRAHESRIAELVAQPVVYLADYRPAIWRRHELAVEAGGGRVNRSGADN